PLERMMELYQVGDGWLPDPRPNPTLSRNPFDLFTEIQPLLAQAYSNPFIWCYDAMTSLSPLLPQLSQPQGLNERWQIEATLRQDLQSLSLMSALVPQAEVLL